MARRWRPADAAGTRPEGQERAFELGLWLAHHTLRPDFGTTDLAGLQKKRKKVLNNLYYVSHSVWRILCEEPYMTLDGNIFENLRMELRRGSLVLAVLTQLRSEQYGYTLRKALVEHGMEIDEGTLYPLLRRLESQGLLVSEWREEEKRNKRFYKLSSDGKAILKQLLAEWKSIDASLNGILKG